MKKIVLQTSISELSEEISGYTRIRFVDWEPDVFISYSFGEELSKPVRKGMTVDIHRDLLIYKNSKLPVTLTVELS